MARPVDSDPLSERLRLLRPFSRMSGDRLWSGCRWPFGSSPHGRVASFKNSTGLRNFRTSFEMKGSIRSPLLPVRILMNKSANKRVAPFTYST